MSACPAAERIVIVRAAGQCLMEAPPDHRRVAFAGPDAGCPREFVTCLGPVAANALEHNLWVSLNWESEAWIRCGPEAEADGGTSK